MWWSRRARDPALAAGGLIEDPDQLACRFDESFGARAQAVASRAEGVIASLVTRAGPSTR
jgi:hypothetical protein